MTVCCYVFRKTKPLSFKTSTGETLKAYRLVFSHNSGREDWGDHYDASDWQIKESRKLKRLRANSYPLKQHQFFVMYYSDTATTLDLWAADHRASKAWDDHDDIPGTWAGKLTKKKSGRGWDYHSRVMVKHHLTDMIWEAFLFIGQDPKRGEEETSEEYYSRLYKAQSEEPDYRKTSSNYWHRGEQMRRHRQEIDDWGQALFQQERFEQQQERKAQ